MTLPTLALFDFDDTLVEGDSLLPFLRYATGTSQTVGALLGASLKRILNRNPAIDTRTLFKEHLLQNLLAGRAVTSLESALRNLQGWVRWKEHARQRLLEHHKEGHHIVIASGGLDLYLPQLLQDTPHHALICTDVEIQNEIITGKMTHGNCVRQRKADRVAAYIAAHGPFGETWGYGNAPHDLPMLNLVKHRLLY